MTDAQRRARLVGLSVVAAVALAFAGSWSGVVASDRVVVLEASRAAPAPTLRRAPRPRPRVVVRRTRPS